MFANKLPFTFHSSRSQLPHGPFQLRVPDILLVFLLSREKANELWQWLMTLEAEKFDLSEAPKRQKDDVSAMPKCVHVLHEMT